LLLVSSGRTPNTHNPPEQPPDSEVLQCFVAVRVPGLDDPDLSVDVLSAMTGLATPIVLDVTRDLCRTDVLTSSRPDWYRLAYVAGTAGAEDTDNPTRQGRFFAYLETALAAVMDALAIAHTDAVPAGSAPVGAVAGFTGSAQAVEWVVAYRGLLLTAVQLGALVGLSQDACWLAAVLWPITANVDVLRVDRAWATDLARHGEEAAIQGRDPHTLGTVLEHSAQLAEYHADRLTAEAQWVRALAVWRELAEHTRVVGVLTALIGLYRSWGRFHRALDAAVELVSETQRAADDRGTALALGAVGVTMLAANRPDSAVDYLNQADRAMSQLVEPLTAEHAHTLVALGRAHWRLGAWSMARRRFSAALALWVDLDDTEADYVRLLLGQPEGEPLPDSP
jgi:hypothetical protein